MIATAPVCPIDAPSSTGLLRCLAVVFPTLLVSSSACLAESWTDLRGTRTIEARMVGVWGETVVLEMGSKKRVSVELNNLRSDSRIQARQIASRMQKQLDQQVNELSKQRRTEAAPAPTPLPRPKPASKYRAPQKNAEIEDFLASVDLAITDGHLIALYDSLPPGYRSDVDEVVALAAANIDNETYVKITSTLQQLGDIIVQKQNWLASSPRVVAAPPSTIEAVEGPLVSLADTFRVVLNDPSFTLDSLQSKPFGEWLRELDHVLAPHLADIQSQSGSLTTRFITVEESTKKDATVNISIEENETTHRFVKVDGFWVPDSYAKEWDGMIANLKKKYSDESLPSMLEVYAPVADRLNALVGPLKSADDAGDFHDVLETTIEPVMSVMQMVAPMFTVSNARRSGSAVGGPRFGNDGRETRDMRLHEDMRRQAEANAAYVPQQP